MSHTIYSPATLSGRTACYTQAQGRLTEEQQSAVALAALNATVHFACERREMVGVDMKIQYALLTSTFDLSAIKNGDISCMRE